MTDAQARRRAYPAGSSQTRWRARDGWELRVFDWPATGGRGSILFQAGRGDMFEKYLETFHHWHALGWRITSVDWRGQGLSGRCTPAPQVGDIDDFGSFIDDIGAYWSKWAAGAEGPRVAIGHSMGGHLILRAMVEERIVPDAAVLIAPMHGLHAPIGPRFGERMARVMASLGNPARAAWKGNERPYTTATRASLLTHDADRYDDETWWQTQNPALVTGPPSWRWLVQAFASTRRLSASPALATMATPTLALVAEADKLVDPAVAIAVTARLPDARLVRFGAEAAHELLRETDIVRDRALTEIDAFLESRAAPYA